MLHIMPSKVSTTADTAVLSITAGCIFIGSWVVAPCILAVLPNEPRALWLICILLPLISILYVLLASVLDGTIHSARYADKRISEKLRYHLKLGHDFAQFKPKVKRGVFQYYFKKHLYDEILNTDNITALQQLLKLGVAFCYGDGKKAIAKNAPECLDILLNYYEMDILDDLEFKEALKELSKKSNNITKLCQVLVNRGISPDFIRRTIDCDAQPKLSEWCEEMTPVCAILMCDADDNPPKKLPRYRTFKYPKLHKYYQPAVLRAINSGVCTTRAALEVLANEHESAELTQRRRI